MGQQVPNTGGLPRSAVQEGFLQGPPFQAPGTVQVSPMAWPVFKRPGFSQRLSVVMQDGQV